jgi:hypothetical protein
MHVVGWWLSFVFDMHLASDAVVRGAGWITWRRTGVRGTGWIAYLLRSNAMSTDIAYLLRARGLPGGRRAGTSQAATCVSFSYVVWI